MKHRVNFIDSLHDSDGQTHKEHNAKAVILWKAFKDRLSTTIPTFDMLQLNDIVQRHPQLNHLDAPFTKEEIEHVIKNLPMGKSPRPAGFTNNFVKACWDIWAEDF